MGGSDSQRWSEVVVALGLQQEWEKTFENFPPNVPRDGIEGRDHRRLPYRPGGTSLLEHYVEGDVFFHVHLWLGDRCVNVESREQCIVFQGPAVCLPGAGAEQIATGVQQLVAGPAPVRRRRMKKAVLIDVAEFVELPESERVGLLASVVRLQALDDCRYARMHAGEPARCERSVLRSAVAYRESDILDDLGGQWGARVVLGEGVDEVVERRTELVDALTDEDAHLGRDGLHVYGPQQYAAATRVELSSSSVGFWLAGEALSRFMYGFEVFPCLADAELDTSDGGVDGGG